MNLKGGFAHLGHHGLGLGWFGLGEYAEAAEQMHKAGRMVPNVPLILLGQISAIWHSGNKEASRALSADLVAWHPTIRVSELHLPYWCEAQVADQYVSGLIQAGIPE